MIQWSCSTSQTVSQYQWIQYSKYRIINHSRPWSHSYHSTNRTRLDINITMVSITIFHVKTQHFNGHGIMDPGVMDLHLRPKVSNGAMSWRRWHKQRAPTLGNEEIPGCCTFVGLDGLAIRAPIVCCFCHPLGFCLILFGFV